MEGADGALDQEPGAVKSYLSLQTKPAFLCFSNSSHFHRVLLLLRLSGSLQNFLDGSALWALKDNGQGTFPTLSQTRTVCIGCEEGFLECREQPGDTQRGKYKQTLLK